MMNTYVKSSGCQSKNGPTNYQYQLVSRVYLAYLKMTTLEFVKQYICQFLVKQ